MPRLYFLSTGAEISNIANLKKFGFQQGLDVLSLILPKSGVKEHRNLRGTLIAGRGGLKIRANGVQQKPRDGLKIETVFWKIWRR